MARAHVASQYSLRSFGLALLCAGVLSGCKKAEETPAPLVYVQAVHPENASLSEEIAADAILAPLAQAAIAPKVTAPVKKFYAQRGSKVKAGQLLATLENQDLAAAVTDNHGSYVAAQATYETATQATVPEDLTKAQLDVAQAKATLDLNQSIVNSRTQLLAQGAIPGRDLDTAKATLVQSQAAYDIAKQHLEAVEKVSHKAALQNAQGQLDSAKGKYEAAQAQLSYTEIRSPIDGVVTDRPLFAGETASAGAPVITVMDTSALLAKLHISQMVAQQLTVGSPATVSVPGMDDPVSAKISLISPALDPGSTTVEVWLRVENAKGTFRAGTAVHARIAGKSAKDALTIPQEAVQIAADRVSSSVMLIASDGTAHKHPVTLGIRGSKLVQVTDGLTTNDMVITTGGYGLDDGTKVKIGAPPADADDKAAAGAKDEK
jgi:HlyD family secretion protein